MKPEDIDKKIGMPDVDKEWARFEREVIGTSKPRFRHAAMWVVGIGVAAAFLLLFVLNTDIDKATEMPMGGQQVALNSHQDDVPTSYQDDNVMRLGSTEADTLPISHSKTTLPQADEQLERRIAQLTIVHTSADLGSGHIMRLGGNPSDNDSVLLVSDIKTQSDTPVISELQGRIAGLNIPDSVRQARWDSILRQREINMDSMLIVVNGKPIPLYKFNHNGLAPYLYKQHQLLSDSDINVEERIGREVYLPYGSNEERKRRCFEIYGERAKYGVIEVTTVPDTYCDAYISKHPELKKERQHIEGYVCDEVNKPLADAWVCIRGKGIGAATDSKGYFSLWLPQTEVELMASHMGYVPCVIKTIKPMLTIRLKSATVIREVKVIPKDSLKHYHFLKQ